MFIHSLTLLADAWGLALASNTIAESHELCRSLVLTTEQSTYERSGDCIFTILLLISSFISIYNLSQ